MKKFFRRLSVVVMTALAFSGCSMADAAASGDAAAMQRNSMYSSIFMLVVFFAFMYFFMFRPEKKRKQQAQQMRDSIEVGDKITTIGGMVGRVVHVTSDTITFETSEDRVRVEIAKWGVSRNDGKGSKEKSDSEEILNSSNE